MTLTRHKSLPAKHPGIVFKKRYLDLYSISIEEAAVFMGMELGELERFVRGNALLTSVLSEKLESYTGISKAFWENQYIKCLSHI